MFTATEKHYPQNVLKVAMSISDACFPGPAAYDPRVKTERGNLMTVRDSRFGKAPEENVPGPGTYSVCTAALYRVAQKVSHYSMIKKSY